MSVRKILSIEHRGLKAHDAAHKLSGFDVFIGENGSGKSSVLDAHRLLVFGAVPGVDANNQGVMSLARGNKIEIIERVELDDGTVTTIERAWKRDRSGSVTQRIEIDGEKVTARDGASRIVQMFAGLPEAWDPGALFDLAPLKLRDRLLRIIPREVTGGALPTDLPEWAKKDLPPIEWSAWVIKTADEKTLDYQADRRKADEIINQLLVGPEVTAGRQIPTAPIEAALAKLRGELVASGDRARAEKDVETTRAKLEAARRAASITPRLGELLLIQGKLAAALGPEGAEAVRVRVADNLHRMRASPAGDEVRRLKAEIDESIREIEARVRRSGEETAKAQRRVDYARAKVQQSDIRDVRPATATEVETTKAALDAIRPEMQAAEDRVSKVKAQLAALAEPTHEACPQCSYSFRDALAAARVKIEADLSDAMFERDEVIGPAYNEASQAHALAMFGVRRAAEDREVAEAEAELAAAKARAPRLSLPPGDSLAVWLDGIQAAASEIVTEAEDQATGAAELPGLEEALAAAEAKLAALPSEARTKESIEADIRATEAKLKSTAALNQNASTIAEAQASIVAIGGLIDEVKAWRARFVEVQEDLLQRAKVWLEARYSALLGGMPVEVQLRSALGAPDCVVLVGGVPLSTLCPGHRAIALAAFVILQAGLVEDGFKFLPVDAIEQVSKGNREAFIRAIKSALDEGTIAQVILSGCPDSVPEVEGVTVHDLDPRAEESRIAV